MSALFIAVDNRNSIMELWKRMVLIEDIALKAADAAIACGNAIQDFAAKLIKLYTEVYKIDVRLVRLENLFNTTTGDLT